MYMYKYISIYILFRFFCRFLIPRYDTTNIEPIHYVGNLYKRSKNGAWILRQFTLTGEGVLQSQKIEKQKGGGRELTSEELTMAANDACVKLSVAKKCICLVLPWGYDGRLYCILCCGTHFILLGVIVAFLSLSFGGPPDTRLRMLTRVTMGAVAAASEPSNAARHSSKTSFASTLEPRLTSRLHGLQRSISPSYKTMPDCGARTSKACSTGCKNFVNCAYRQYLDFR